MDRLKKFLTKTEFSFHKDQQECLFFENYYFYFRKAIWRKYQNCLMKKDNLEKLITNKKSINQLEFNRYFNGLKAKSEQLKKQIDVIDSIRDRLREIRTKM